MACGCKKAKDRQDKLIELNDRIADSMNPISRSSLKVQKRIIETQENLGKSVVIVFFKKLILSILVLPFIVLIFGIVGITLFIYVLTSIFMRIFFKKEIGGVMSPFAMYYNIKHSFINTGFNKLKEKFQK